MYCRLTAPSAYWLNKGRIISYDKYANGFRIRGKLPLFGKKICSPKRGRVKVGRRQTTSPARFIYDGRGPAKLTLPCACGSSTTRLPDPACADLTLLVIVRLASSRQLCRRELIPQTALTEHSQSQCFPCLQYHSLHYTPECEHSRVRFWGIPPLQTSTNGLQIANRQEGRCFSGREELFT